MLGNRDSWRAGVTSLPTGPTRNGCTPPLQRASKELKQPASGSSHNRVRLQGWYSDAGLQCCHVHAVWPSRMSNNRCARGSGKAQPINFTTDGTRTIGSLLGVYNRPVGRHHKDGVLM